MRMKFQNVIKNSSARRDLILEGWNYPKRNYRESIGIIQKAFLVQIFRIIPTPLYFVWMNVCVQVTVKVVKVQLCLHYAHITIQQIQTVKQPDIIFLSKLIPPKFQNREYNLVRYNYSNKLGSTVYRSNIGISTKKSVSALTKKQKPSEFKRKIRVFKHKCSQNQSRVITYFYSD